MATYTQPTSAPTAKVAAVGYAGIITTLVPLLVFVLTSLNVHIGNTSDLTNSLIAIVAAVVTIYQAITAAVHFAAGYFKESDTSEIK